MTKTTTVRLFSKAPTSYRIITHFIDGKADRWYITSDSFEDRGLTIYAEDQGEDRINHLVALYESCGWKEVKTDEPKFSKAPFWSRRNVSMIMRAYILSNRYMALNPNPGSGMTVDGAMSQIVACGHNTHQLNQGNLAWDPTTGDITEIQAQRRNGYGEAYGEFEWWTTEALVDACRS
ncbi:MAG: hypothetical protein GY811_06000 [Myxococcales bacterium]|nr:hypothetical protein [Myxococcales bacterium]